MITFSIHVYVSSFMDLNYSTRPVRKLESIESAYGRNFIQEHKKEMSYKRRIEVCKMNISIDTVVRKKSSCFIKFSKLQKF